MDSTIVPGLLDRAIEEYRSAIDLRSLQKAVQRLKDLPEQATGYPAGYRPRTLSILSNYSTQFIGSALRLALIERAVWPTIHESGYNQWELVARNPADPAFTCQPDFVLLLLSSLELAYSADGSPAETATRIVQAIQSIHNNTHAKLYLTLPEPLEEEFSVVSWAGSWRSALVEELKRRVHPEVTLIDLGPLISKIGAQSWYSTRYYVTAKLAFHPDQTAAFASYIANLVRGSISMQCKLVITDLDNTLWGGEVGEVGWQSVDLDIAGKGYAFLRLQRFLKGLRERGVLLAIASKNSPEVARAVFANRPEMALREVDFVGREISWGPKSRGVQRILDQLNLSTSGVLFLDDSPFERNEVRSAFPEIIVPDLPEDVTEWVPWLIDTGLFERPEVTVEDLERKTFYEHEHVRQSTIEQTGDYESFLRSAQMKLYPEEVRDNHKRFLDLINKTNQFNMTNRRHGWSYIQSMLSAGGLAFCFRLCDRFGAYGAISSVLIVPESPQVYRIDTWVLSCRAMGRTVENTIMQYLVDVLAARGAKRLIGEYIESPKNGPSKLVYEKLGFRSLGTSGNLWEMDLADRHTRDLNRFIEVMLTPDVATVRSASAL